jgi:uncharacterized membrane protein YgdD (TMEM256/DUF423 family)
MKRLRRQGRRRNSFQADERRSKLDVMQRAILLTSAISGFLAVALGAFGAHGLKSSLATVPDGMQRLEWWQTAAQYHLIHAVGLGLVAALSEQHRGRSLVVAAVAFAMGCLIFSGSLYVMALSGMRALGAVTPLGGLAFLVGWAALAYHACYR